MQPGTDSTYRANATRTLSCTGAAARAAILRGVIVAGFRVESEQLTGIRAQRGSKLAGAGQRPDKLPMLLTVRFADGGDARCEVRVALQDRWSGALGRPPSLAAAYRASFQAVVADLDSVLAALDPAATGAFEPMDCTVPAGLGASAGPGRTGQLLDRADRALSATPGSARRGAIAPGSVALALPDVHAVVEMSELQAMMTAGTMIATRPGGLPERLARQIARVVGVLEGATPQPGPQPGVTRIDLDAAARPVLEFLRLQARMRARLPLRTVQVCTTCRLEKIVNPDFQRLQARNRKLRILSGTIGGAISPHGVSAFLLIGRLAQLKLLDPDFVCPRCQGMTAESSLITFCPRCGDRRAEAALRTCTGCGHDLRTEVLAEPMWTAGAPEQSSVSVTRTLADLPPPIPGTRIGPAGPDMPGSAEAVGRAAALAGAYPPAAWPAPPGPAAWDPAHPGAAPGFARHGWHPDPHGRHEYRWWDGERWTAHVADRGVSAVEA